MLTFVLWLRVKDKKNQWTPCLSISYITFSLLQRNNEVHASKGPCQAGFSQSFYSVLISRDVLQGRGLLKGKAFNWQISFLFCFCQAALTVRQLPSCVKASKRDRASCDGFHPMPGCVHNFQISEALHLQIQCETRERCAIDSWKLNRVFEAQDVWKHLRLCMTEMI